MKFLQRKNSQFFDTVRELIEEHLVFTVQLWIEDAKHISYEDLEKYNADNFYYTLIVVNFIDEGDYDRSMTIPVPILFKSRKRGAVLFRRWLKENWDRVVFADRECYERYGHREPICEC